MEEILNRKSRFEISAVVKRMKHAVGVHSVAALSQYLGYKSNAIQNTVSRGHIPYKEAALVAINEGISLDWLIFGRDMPGMSGERIGSKQDQEDGTVSYPEARQRGPALFIAEDMEDTGSWGYPSQQTSVVLREVIESVDMALAEDGLTLPSAKKAELTATLCEIYVSVRTRPNQDHIRRLVRSLS